MMQVLSLTLIGSAIIGFIIGEALLIIPALYAKNKGIKGWGWTFLPVIGFSYVTGALSDQYVDKKYRILLPVITTIATVIYIPGFINYISNYLKFMEQVMENGEPTEAMLISFFTSMAIMFITLIPMIVVSVFEYIAYYRMFAFANKEQAVMWLLLTIFFSIPVYIFWLMYMNKPGMAKDEVTVTEPVA